jgi:lipoate-protein ligase A
MIWRVVRHNGPDAKMNEAIEEAMLIARHEGQSLDTIRPWQNRKTVVLARDADVSTTVNGDEVESNGVSIVRRAGAGKTVYQDEGTLNFTYTIDRKILFPGDPPPSSVYKALCQPAAEAMFALGLDSRIDDYGQCIVAKGGTISETSVNFYYDFILFQVSLNVYTDLAMSARVLKEVRRVTSLSNELNRHVGLDEIEGILMDALSRRFKIELQEQDLSQIEAGMADKLSQVKYSTDDWNLQGKAPLTLKQLLMELYVAYPPTTSCRELIANTQMVIADFRDKVEVRIWMRNRGLDGHGWPSGVQVSPALERVAKQSLIPSVIVSGRVEFSQIVPTRAEIRNRILGALEKSR